MVLNDIPNDFESTENVCDIPHDFEATENVCDIPNDEATEKISVMSFK